MTVMSNVTVWFSGVLLGNQALIKKASEEWC